MNFKIRHSQASAQHYIVWQVNKTLVIVNPNFVNCEFYIQQKRRRSVQAVIFTFPGHQDSGHKIIISRFYLFINSFIFVRDYYCLKNIAYFYLTLLTMYLLSLNVLPYLIFSHLIFISVLTDKYGIITFCRLNITSCPKSYFTNNIFNQHVITFSLQCTINYYTFVLSFSEIYEMKEGCIWKSTPQLVRQRKI